MTTIITKRVVDLSSTEFNRCRELTHGIEGYMREELDAAVERDLLERPRRHTMAAMIVEEGTILGWSLLQPVPRTSRYKAYFYVDPERRGEGFGRMLMQEAKRWGRYKIKVIPDYSNWRFFEKFSDYCMETR